MKIITHKNIDLDATVGVYFLLQKFPEAEVDFGVEQEGNIYADCSPANPEQEDTQYIFDHHLPELQKQYPSAAGIIYNHFNLGEGFLPLKMEADYQDSGENFRTPKEYQRIGLANILAGFRFQGFSDEQILTSMMKIFDAIVARERTRGRFPRPSAIGVKKDLQEANFQIYKGIKFVYLESPSPSLSAYLFEEKKIHIVIFKDGNNTGFSRNAIFEAPDLRKLEEHIQEEGWFFHPKGFLAARGTRKVPASSPSRYSKEELIQLLEKIL